MPDNERFFRDEVDSIITDLRKPLLPEEPPCGLWWILSTVTTAVFVGITVGLVFWLYTA